MAIVGGAVLTPMMGLLAEFLHSTALAYQIPLYGNLGVAAYSHYMAGYRGCGETLDWAGKEHLRG
jgi:MFS transporter, FHS family, L-fucose permease